MTFPPFILPETGPQVHLDLEARFLLSRENHLICNFGPDLESFVVQSDIFIIAVVTHSYDLRMRLKQFMIIWYSGGIGFEKRKSV